MLHIRRVGLLGCCIALSADAPAHASEQSSILHPTTPYEYWHDYCDYPDVIPNAYEITGGSLQRLMSAEGMMVLSSEIVQRDDDPNFWRFKNTSPMQNYPGTTDPISGQV